MEIVLRVTVIYVCIVAGLRVLGKREFGQLSPVELVTLLLVPEMVSNALTGADKSLTGALLAVGTLFTLVFGLSLVMHRFRRAEVIVTGSPTVLVARGRLLQDALNRQRIAPDEVLGELRRSGLARLDEVEWAVLETDGRISIVPAKRSGPSAPPEPRTTQ